jgi:hypothetical protein
VAAVGIVLGVLVFTGKDGKEAQAGNTQIPVVAPDSKTKPENVKPAVEEKVKVDSILINTDPSGAYLYKDNSLLGQTPFKVPRPTSQDTEKHYEVRLLGYEKADVAIVATTPETFTVTLEKKKSEESPPLPSKLPADGKNRRKSKQQVEPTGDIKDPWAN